MRMVGWRRDVGGCLGCDVFTVLSVRAAMGLVFSLLVISYSCLLCMYTTVRYIFRGRSRNVGTMSREKMEM